MPQTEILCRPDFHSLPPTPTGQTSSSRPITALCWETPRSLSFFLCRNQLLMANTRTAGSPPASRTRSPPSAPITAAHHTRTAPLHRADAGAAARPGPGRRHRAVGTPEEQSFRLGQLPAIPEARSSQTGAARVPKRLRAHEGRTKGRAASRPPLPQLKHDRAATPRAPQRSPTCPSLARPPPSPGRAHRPHSGPTSARPRRRVPTYFLLPGHKQSAQSAALQAALLATSARICLAIG